MAGHWLDSVTRNLVCPALCAVVQLLCAGCRFGSLLRLVDLGPVGGRIELGLQANPLLSWAIGFGPILNGQNFRIDRLTVGRE
jgi:hypothetical protein